MSFSEQAGGLLTLDDFANYHSQLEAPVQAIYRGLTIYRHRTWLQSATLLQARNI